MEGKPKRERVERGKVEEEGGGKLKHVCWLAKGAITSKIKHAKELKNQSCKTCTTVSKLDGAVFENA